MFGVRVGMISGRGCVLAMRTARKRRDLEHEAMKLRKGPAGSTFVLFARWMLLRWKISQVHQRPIGGVSR